nr:hypothetical protein BaRGS_027401 [Batillaria attramentaria]
MQNDIVYSDTVTGTSVKTEVIANKILSTRRLLLVSAVALWSPGLSYFNYQAKLPNGQHVPHPCKPNYIWHGVGHQNPLGGGERNQFGLDFASHGHKWTAELCHMDSDKDGLTNGQELGDPHCVWTEGSIPTSTDNITHPGICDPWNSQACGSRNTWVSCEVGEFHCDAIHQPDVQNITLRFPRTKVPTAETTYTCFAFDIPSTETYHLIANTPYIDNPNVVHHIVVYACDDTAQLSSEPVDCLMGYPGCTKQIAVWTVGMTGVTLYYTPKLRPYDAASFSIGQLYPDPLEVLPGDELKMICEYASLSKNRTTQYGAGSYNEMCFGIITYYPAQNLDLRGAAACMEYKGVDICSMNQSGLLTTSDLPTEAQAIRDACPAGKGFTSTCSIRVNTDISRSYCRCSWDHKNEMSAAQTFLQLAKELGSRPLLQNIIMNVNEG